MKDKKVTLTNLEIFFIILGIVCFALGVGYAEFGLLLLIGGLSLFFALASVIVRLQKSKSD